MSQTTRKVNVVVLDDDPSITRMVDAYLRGDFGDRLQVTVFNQAHEAQQFIDINGCDLLISDIEMPAIDGLEMLQFTKQRNAWTQVLFMTAHSTWDRINAAIESGASDYLLKPITREELNRVVQNELARLCRWRQAVVGTFRAASMAAC